MKKVRGRKPKFAIEKGIPIPPKSKGQNGNSRATKYPFGAMKVGDSFFAPKSTARAAVGAATSYKRNHKDIEFASRKEGTGIRIWRTK